MINLIKKHYIILSNMKKNKILISAILLISFILRVWSIQFGLPRALYPDEIVVIHNAFVTMAKGLLQGFAAYSILTSYLMIPILGIYYILGKFIGLFSDPVSYYLVYSINPSIPLLAGRLVMVGISVSLVYLTYLAGSYLLTKKAGILSAWFLATAFLPGVEGIYIKDDTLVALLILLSFWFAFNKRTLLSGVLVGVATASHYYPAAIIPLLIYLLLLDIKENNVLRFNILTKFALSTTLAFFITNPNIILAHQRFVVSLTGIWNYQLTKTVGSFGFERWLYFTYDLLFLGWGPLPLLMTCLGIIIGLKSRQKTILIIITAVALLYFALLIGGAEFIRYGLILFPFISILCAFGVHYTSKLSLKYHKIIYLLLCLIIPVVNIVRIIKLKTLLLVPDIRYEAETWIEKNIPENSKILIDGYQTPVGLSFQNVYVFYSRDLLDQYRLSAKKFNQPQYIYDILDRLAEGHTRYDLTTVPELSISWDSKQQEYEKATSSAWIKDTQDYVVTSSWVQNTKKIDDIFWSEFNNEWIILKEFSAHPQLKYNPLGWRYDFESIDSINPFDPKLSFGPKITIYQKRYRN